MQGTSEMAIGAKWVPGTLWLFNIAMENAPFIDDLLYILKWPLSVAT